MSSNPVSSNTMSSHIAEMVKKSLQRAAVDVSDAAITAGSQMAMNGISRALGVGAIQQNRPPQSRRQSDDSDVIDVEATSIDEANTGRHVSDSRSGDNEEYEDLEERVIPIAFQSFSREENFQCAAAIFRMQGYRDDDYPDGGSPDIVATNETTGIGFTGTIPELAEFCKHENLDDKWSIYGLVGEGEYDSSEIDQIRISKKVFKFIATQLISDSYNHEDMAAQFKKNHVSTGSESVTRFVKNIPFLNGVPMSHFAVPYAIIYGAEKNGKFETYIHEFGEESKEKPMMLTVGDGKSDPRSLVITGGRMVIKNGYICF